MSTKKVGVLRFPGTNCDRDIWQAVEQMGQKPEWLWYQDQFDLSAFESFILPGGFSYGDYLRSGALAAHAPVMKSLKDAVEKGYPVFGICNGFQILCEAGLLPGVLMRNNHRRFLDTMVDLKIEASHTRFGAKLTKGQTVRMPIAHADGCYYVPEKDLKAIQDNNQVYCTYVKNPNGSVGNIAGVMNKTKNVVGMMPHPERAMYEWMGSDHGVQFF
ncbi:MAG: phosphoribosylformylglycinamidine synthase subunit PurQ [Bdellovibrionaceae bacterium]|nr:phosphoribosylformylglycinamidine synthase subunit PurQ [Pseudobdellovibrionaceae bacterium]